MGISSLADTWLLLKTIEIGGERNRGMYILKSRGMAHSNQIREYIFTNTGVDILDVYVGPEACSPARPGSPRRRRKGIGRKRSEGKSERLELNMEKRRSMMDAQIAQVRTDFEYEKNDLANEIDKRNIALHPLPSTGKKWP